MKIEKWSTGLFAKGSPPVFSQENPFIPTSSLKYDGLKVARSTKPCPWVPNKKIFIQIFASEFIPTNPRGKKCIFAGVVGRLISGTVNFVLNLGTGKLI